MSFKIKNIVGATAMRISNEILKAQLRSRFTFQMGMPNNGKVIEIRTIRLIQSKDYCGNHPLPCPVRPFQAHKPHIHSKCLEGADWVAFNDMLNDILDKLKVSANVASSHVIIRKGLLRCVNYDSRLLSNGIENEWVKDSHFFEDWTGRKAGRSVYPPGTPGIAEWKACKNLLTIHP